MSFNWASIKSVALHAFIVFATVLSTTLAATGWSVSKATVVAAVSAGATAVLHYLSGLLPNAAATVNRAKANKAA